MKTQTERRWPEREECDPLDVEALDRCIDQARRDERGLDKGRYDRLLKERQWYDVGLSAVYHCQMVSLGLAPHEFPPCLVSSRSGAPQRPFRAPTSRSQRPPFPSGHKAGAAAHRCRIVAVRARSAAGAGCEGSRMSVRLRSGSVIAGESGGASRGAHGFGYLGSALRRDGLTAHEFILQLSTFLRSGDLFLKLRARTLPDVEVVSQPISHGVAASRAQTVPSFRVFILAQQLTRHARSRDYRLLVYKLPTALSHFDRGSSQLGGRRAHSKGGEVSFWEYPAPAERQRSVDQRQAPLAYRYRKKDQAAKSNAAATTTSAVNPMPYKATCSFISLIRTPRLMES